MPPDPVGWRHYRNALASTRLNALVESFLCSEEFRNQPMYSALVGATAESEPMVLELDGRLMYVDPSDPMSEPLIGGVGWEPDVTTVVTRLLRPGWTVLDIGANVGYFTLLAASHVRATGKVHAFEPGRDNCGLLQLSVIANRFGNVVVHGVALTDQPGVLLYERLVGTNARVRVVDLAQPVRIGGRRQLVQGVRLDDLDLPLTRVDLVKIDIEGAEMRALDGAAQMLRRFRPLLVTEFSPPGLQSVSGVSGQDYLDFLARLGYADIAVIEPDGSATSYGLDAGRVVDAWEASGRDHLDLLVSPAS